MRNGMRNPHEIKFKLYTERMTKLNKYSDIFTGFKASNKILYKELNYIYCTACQMVGLVKRTYRDLVLGLFCLNRLLTYLR